MNVASTALVASSVHPFAVPDNCVTGTDRTTSARRERDLREVVRMPGVEPERDDGAGPRGEEKRITETRD